MAAERFDLERLDDDRPFEIDSQVSHLFKHAGLGVDDIREVVPFLSAATSPQTTWHDAIGRNDD